MCIYFRVCVCVLFFVACFPCLLESDNVCMFGCCLGNRIANTAPPCIIRADCSTKKTTFPFAPLSTAPHHMYISINMNILALFRFFSLTVE